MKNEMKKQTGITLIALVITIIVLLILAGVSIATLTGENGILTKASGTKLATEQAEILEKLRMEVYENKLDIENKVTEIEFLKSKGIIIKEVSQESETVGELGKYASINRELSIAEVAEDSGNEICYIIDITKVIQNPTTGKGSWENGDVYYILNGDLYYKEKDKQSKKQGQVFKETSSTAKIKWIYHENADGNIEITGMDTSQMDVTVSVMPRYI